MFAAPTPTLRARTPRDSARDPTAPQTREAPTDHTHRERRLCCAACTHAITDRDAAISVQGGHEHHFVNPHGLAFHVGLFDRAPGCILAGSPVAFFSWFPGLPWRLAACGACHVHLGWAWGDGPQFYGLILPRLRDADRDAD